MIISTYIVLYNEHTNAYMCACVAFIKYFFLHVYITIISLLFSFSFCQLKHLITHLCHSILRRFVLYSSYNIAPFCFLSLSFSLPLSPWFTPQNFLEPFIDFSNPLPHRLPSTQIMSLLWPLRLLKLCSTREHFLFYLFFFSPLLPSFVFFNRGKTWEPKDIK